jgi:hypothetical protein
LGLKALVKMSGFALATILLTALIGAGPAAAQNNTKFGTGALTHNTTGTHDSAFGFNALNSNTTGSFNTASGAFSLLRNTTGGLNTASGVGALESNTTGGFNIGLGAFAGSNIRTGSNNIDIGSASLADESLTIRIGAPLAQTVTFIAGIFGQTVNANGVPVLVDNTGKLGVVVSSARYKRDIRDMDAASAGMMKLRPVTFRYKNDPSGTLQYGLVAEEVARVYPELVVHGTDGKPLTVRYLELNAMLLNELQKQARENRELRSEVAQVREAQAREQAAQQREIDALKQKDASINALSERFAALEQQVRAGNSARFDSLARK